MPDFDAIANGIGNGTIAAVDVKTGKIKWTYPTEFPTWVSPAVTNGLVFSGQVTATRKPYIYNDFGQSVVTPLNPSGIIMALDKDTGKKLWEFNVGAPVGIGGPSIGHCMLFVTTGNPVQIGSNKGGDIIAFGLPESQNNDQTRNVNTITNEAEVISTHTQTTTAGRNFQSEPPPSSSVASSTTTTTTLAVEPTTTNNNNFNCYND